MLKKYGETYDGEDWRDRATRAERERDEIRRKYRDRFLYGMDKKLKRLRTKKKPMAEKSSASKKKILSATEKKKQTFEELFEEREG